MIDEKRHWREVEASHHNAQSPGGKAMRIAGEVRDGEEFRYRGMTFTRICLPGLPYVVRWQPSASAWFASWVQCHQNQIMVQEKDTGAILSLDTDQTVDEAEAECRACAVGACSDPSHKGYQR